MAVCKKCGGTINNPKRCPYWEQIMIYPLFGNGLRRLVTFCDAGSADIVPT